MNSNAHKVCPACGQHAVISMAVCGRCGFRYDGGGQITATRREVARALGSGQRRWQQGLLLAGLILLVAGLGTAGIVFVVKGSSAGTKRGANLFTSGISADQIDQRLT